MGKQSIFISRNVLADWPLSGQVIVMICSLNLFETFPNTNVKREIWRIVMWFFLCFASVFCLFRVMFLTWWSTTHKEHYTQRKTFNIKVQTDTNVCDTLWYIYLTKCMYVNFYLNPRIQFIVWLFHFHFDFECFGWFWLVACLLADVCFDLNVHFSSLFFYLVISSSFSGVSSSCIARFQQKRNKRCGFWSFFFFLSFVSTSSRVSTVFWNFFVFIFVFFSAVCWFVYWIFFAIVMFWVLFSLI